MQLFAAFTDLWVASETGVSRSGLASVVLDLFDYLRAHFAEEESLMEAIGYPHLAEQRTAHAQFTYVLTQAAADLLGDPAAPAEPLQSYAHAWLKEHAASLDLALAEYLEARNC